jgi:hypothetical protein
MAPPVRISAPRIDGEGQHLPQFCGLGYPVISVGSLTEALHPNPIQPKRMFNHKGF